MKSAIEVRDHIVRTLRRDLIGPDPTDTDIIREVLPARPSRWYLTGYLVPRDAPEDERAGTSATEGDITSGEGADGLDDAVEIDPGSGRATFLPSSIGLSVLVPEGITSLTAIATWVLQLSLWRRVREERVAPLRSAYDLGRRRQSRRRIAHAHPPRRAVDRFPGPQVVGDDLRRELRRDQRRRPGRWNSWPPGAFCAQDAGRQLAVPAWSRFASLGRCSDNEPNRSYNPAAIAQRLDRRQ